MRWIDLATESATTLRKARWAITYATVDAVPAPALTALSRHVSGVVMGCTSSQGVFTPNGFQRGAFALVGEETDGINAAVASRPCGATQARARAREATLELVARLGSRPDTMLLHATPGFEERLLEGIDEAFDGKAPAIYGGSAADDDLSGRWRVLTGSEQLGEGFALAGFASTQPVHGAFVSGYLPGAQRGTVTRASGRTVFEIDRRPAALVYDEWRSGALAKFLGGGVVLGETTLHPVGRLVDRVGNVPRYLLSHPHEITRSGQSLSFFTDFAAGDEIVLMVGSQDSLLSRTEQVVHRAMAGSRSDAPVRGGVLIYCGGCVMAIGDRTSEVSALYSRAIKGAPFVGAATFGEVGCFTGPTPTNRHGNLMCDTILFT